MTITTRQINTMLLTTKKHTKADEQQAILAIVSYFPSAPRTPTLEMNQDTHALTFGALVPDKP